MAKGQYLSPFLADVRSKVIVSLLLIHCLLLLTLSVEVFRWVLVFCDVVLNVITRLAVVLLRKMKLVALLYRVVDVVWWPVSLPRGWCHVLFGSRGGSRTSGKGGHMVYVCVCVGGGSHC